MALLEIENLHAGVDDKTILNGFDLTIEAGEVHAIMGPNGSGKSTLSYVLAGRDGYEAQNGAVRFDGADLLDMEPEARAIAGMFLAFQYPLEIPGVTNMTFLRTALNAVRRGRGEDEMDPASFLRMVREKSRAMGVDDDMLKRPLNVGFSGGEKKRNEVLQMAVLEPRLAILDETDSGLDIDALQTVADGVNAMRSDARGMLVITHYQRLLDFIKPDFVHVMVQGRIVRSGGPELAEELERSGYGAYLGAETGGQGDEAGPRMLDATAHFEAVHELLPGGAEVLQARKAALARAEQTGCRPAATKTGTILILRGC